MGAGWFSLFEEVALSANRLGIWPVHLNLNNVLAGKCCLPVRVVQRPPCVAYIQLEVFPVGAAFLEDTACLG